MRLHIVKKSWKSKHDAALLRIVADTRGEISCAAFLSPHAPPCVWRAAQMSRDGVMCGRRRDEEINDAARVSPHAEIVARDAMNESKCVRPK
jgi:hypothetical protein